MPHAYAIDSADVERAVISAVERRFETEREAVPVNRLTYYDTFEWRLFFDGKALSFSAADGGGMLGLHSLNGSPGHRTVCDREPGFVWDLPAGPVREALADRVEMRRLLPRVRVELRGQVLKILDDNQKTRVRLAFERGFASVPAGKNGRHRLPRSVSVLPVRGYDKEATKIVRFLERELKLAATEPSAMARALAAVGEKPKKYSSKVMLPLERSCPAAEATKRILSKLFEIMRANEAGLREDLDSEFLHDFRVSVRRTRSAMSQIKGVFPAEEIARFRADFKWLGGLTGPTRDLDVYLLKMPRYRANLPEALREDLDPLEAFLIERQKVEHRLMVKGLGTRRYRSFLRDYAKWLDAPPTTGEDAPNADRPIVEVASKRIRKAFRLVLRDGSAIEPSSPARLLHELRIDGKKLRYLVEFFSGLHEPALIKPVARNLKTLQDNLGDLNDLHVQQESLKSFAEQMAKAGDADERTMIAIGRLVERLHTEEAAERKRFDGCFAEFSSKDNLDRFRRIVGKKR